MTRTITGTIEHRGRGEGPTISDVIAMFEEARGSHGIPGDAEIALVTIDPARYGEWRVSVNYRVPHATHDQRELDRLHGLMGVLQQVAHTPGWSGWGSHEDLVCLMSTCATELPAPHARTGICPPPRDVFGQKPCKYAALQQPDGQPAHTPQTHYWRDWDTGVIWQCLGPSPQEAP